MWSQRKQNNDAVLQQALWCIHLSSNCINELLFSLDPSLKKQNGRHQWTFFNTILHSYIKPPKISYSNIYTITIYIVSLPKNVNHILWAPSWVLSAHILLHVCRCRCVQWPSADSRTQKLLVIWHSVFLGGPRIRSTIQEPSAGPLRFYRTSLQRMWLKTYLITVGGETEPSNNSSVAASTYA